MVAFVNDNVRYGSEVIPVDFISLSFAEQFGFKVKKVYALKQKKGNSSHKIAKFGRIALRKSITILEKK
jgi:site-specific DNA-methyltransferase (cytosine-N4-specific)